MHCGREYGGMLGGEGVPGVVHAGWVAGRAIPVYYPATLPVPIFSHILASKPYPGPNEGNSRLFYEVSQIWPQI